MFAGLVSGFPAGNSVAILQSTSSNQTMALMAGLNSFTYDFVLRNRLGGLNLNYFVIAETPIPRASGFGLEVLSNISIRLCLPSTIFAEQWLQSGLTDKNWKKLFALTDHERLRLKVINDAVCAFLFGLKFNELNVVLEDCDLPTHELSGKNARSLNPKGFWRINKGSEPELRHTVLSLVAFKDLQEKGLKAFMSQNDGEGWLIPEQLRLADYGLGHDDRAQKYQPVASRLGPRFYDWQLDEDVERSWQECAAHAELIRRIVPLPAVDEDQDIKAKRSTEKPLQGKLL